MPPLFPILDSCVQEILFAHVYVCMHILVLCDNRDYVIIIIIMKNIIVIMIIFLPITMGNFLDKNYVLATANLLLLVGKVCY